MRRTWIFLFLLCFASAHAQTVMQTDLYTFPDPDPENGLVIAYMLQAADGNMYGYNADLFFKVTTAGDYTVIADPSTPTFGASMIQGPDGKFYGPGGSGIIRVTTSGQITNYPLPFNIPNQQYPDGADAVGLTLGSDGNFYGVATEGGPTSSQPTNNPGYGTIFKMTPEGAFSLIYAFTGGAADGGQPTRPLVQASDGNFYGTTSVGGLGIGQEECFGLGCGTVFRITPQGTLTTLYKFGLGQNTQDAYSPLTAMVEAEDGNLYGIHQYADGDPDEDVLFRINPSGQYTVAYSNVFSNESGSELGYSLFLGSDGNLYMDDFASVIQASPSGVTTYYLDASGSDSAPSPFGFQILQGSDGSFYGAYGSISKLSQTPPLPAPVQVALSASTVMPGTKVTASLKVLNAFSLTMQQCYAFQNGTPLGKVPGTYSASTKLYTFATTFTPTQAGTYNYGVTCGGVESGTATLQVGYPTTTTLAASANPVTPPATETLTATVSRTGAAGTPTGSVTFTSGTIVIGTAGLNGSGVATLTTSTSGVPAGTYPVVAKYGGDTLDGASSSSGVSVVVQ